VADPLFVDPSAFNFNFKKMSVARKIKFIPFDYSEAGVYGSDDWKQLARFDPELSARFDTYVKELENK